MRSIDKEYFKAGIEYSKKNINNIDSMNEVISQLFNIISSEEGKALNREEHNMIFAIAKTITLRRDYIRLGLRLMEVFDEDF